VGDVRVVQLGGQLDLAKKPVGGDADQQLRVENLERDGLAPGLARQEDAGVPAFPDLSLDLVPPLEGLADQCQHVASNDRVLVGDSPMVTATAAVRK